MTETAKPTRSRRTNPGRPPLDRAQLVTSAISIADAEGLDAVTIRRLAGEHGVTAMALYWHFKDKEELLDAMAERLFAETVLPEPDARPWHEQLRDILAAFLASGRPHPAIVSLVMTGALSSTAGLTVTERTLGCLRAGGFSSEQSADVMCYVVSALTGLVAMEPGAEPPGSDREQVIRVKKARLDALPPQEYPHLVAAAPAFTTHTSADTYYRLGLDLLITGVRGIAPKARSRARR